MPERRSISVSDNVVAKLREIAQKMGGGYVEVGFLEGAKYPDGTSVATAAYMDEYGHAGRFPTPPRPFFRNMIREESPTWPKKMATIAKATDYDGQKVLGFMGEDIQGDLYESIIKTNDPPLSETTLRLRAKFGNHPEAITASDVVEAQRDVAAGKSVASGTQAKPLVWTGTMLRAVAPKTKAYKVFK